MTKENFIHYQNGQNGGQDFSQDLLSDIYDRICMWEIRIDDDTEPALGPVCARASSRYARPGPGCLQCISKCKAQCEG